MTLTTTAASSANIYVLFLHVVLLVQAQIFRFLNARLKSTSSAGLLSWETRDIEFKAPSASDWFEDVVCDTCVCGCVCAADARWVGVALCDEVSTFTACDTLEVWRSLCRHKCYHYAYQLLNIFILWDSWMWYCFLICI